MKYLRSLFTRCTVFIVTAFFLTLPVYSYANSSNFTKQINYQAKLTDSSSVTVPDGSYNIRFKLYNTLTGGSPIWTSTLIQNDRVAVASGQFSVMLGATSTSLIGVDFNQPLYLSVDIGGTANTATPTFDGEMSPRKTIGTVSHAFIADTLDGLDSTSFVRTDSTSTIATSSTQTILTINQLGSGDVLSLQGSGSAFLTVTNGGKVGIGTTSPASKFAVQGESLFSGNLSIAGLTATGTIIFSGLGTSMLVSINSFGNLVSTSTPTAGYYLATSTIASVFPYASTTAITSTGSDFFATAGGSVGIGTTTPFGRLAIQGTSNQASTTPLLAIGSSTPLTGGAYFSVSGRGAADLRGRAIDPEFIAETRGTTPGTTLDQAFGVFVVGNYAYVSNATRASLAVINIASSTNPVFVAETRGPTPGTSLSGIRKIYVVGNYAYTANVGRDSVAVIDISNPANPTFIAETRGPVPGTSLDGATDIFVSGNYAYVAVQNNSSFAVIDISNPANPTFIGQTSGPTPGTSLGAAIGVYVLGNYAYVANFSRDSLAVIDVSNPTNPTFIAETQGSTPGTSLDGAHEISVVGNYAYVTAGNRDSLAVIDISNPASPTFVAETRGPTAGTSLDASNGLFISGNYAYIANQNRDSVAVIDISNPNNPTFVAETQGPTPGTSLDGATDIFVSGNYAYVTAQNRDSLAVVDLSGATISNLAAGSIKSNALQVDGYGQFTGPLVTHGGLNVGHGALINGTLSVGAASTTLSNFIAATLLGNVAVGTSTSFARLTIVGASTTANSYAMNVLNSASTTLFTISNGGNVGIGTTSPASNLSVQGNALFSGNVSMAGLIATDTITFSGLGTSMLASINASGNLVSSSTPTAAYYLATSTIASIFPYASTTALTSTGSAYFAITGGSVGIGTSTPVYSLDVATTTRTANLIAQNLTFSSSYGSILSAVVGSSTGFTNFSGGIGTGGADSINNAFNNALRITNTGNLVNIGSIQGGETLLTSGGTFGAKTDYTTGTNPEDVSMGDLNGDGKVDLVAGNYSDSSISVLINNGNGTFASKVDYSTGAGPQKINVGDINGDGKADIVTANYLASTISVFVNNGNGTFATKVDYATAANPQDVAIGDLNGDGKADMVAATNGGFASVFINKGNGTFATKVDYVTYVDNGGVAIGDVNGDGKADLETVDYDNGNFSVLINNGNGTFTAKVDYATGGNSTYIAFGDLNGDGIGDVAVANYNTPSISVLINNGNGTFATKVDYTTGTQPYDIAFGDVNGDGKPDIAVTNRSSNTVSIFINNGNGTFAPRVDYATATKPDGVAIGDVNGDGKADIAVANENSNSISVFLNQSTPMFYANASSGNIGIGTSTPTTTPQALFAKLTTWGASTSANTYAFNAVNSASTTLFTISNSGNVGIATTSPWRTFDVNGTVGFAGLTNDTADNRVLCLTSSNEVVANAGTSCITSSQRFKQNILSLDNNSGLAEVMKLNPVSYEYKDGIGITGTQVGFIAEEMQKIDPRLVVLDASSSPFTVRYENLTAVLAKGLQELNINLESLASTTALLTETDSNGATTETFVGRFFSRIIAWFADVKNGIGDLYANVFRAKEKFCVDDQCLTKDDIRKLLELESKSSDTNTPGDSTDSPQTTDTESPVIQLIGDVTSTLKVGDSFVDPGATVTDNVDHNLGVQTIGSVDTTQVGEYVLKYNATDSAGNKALELIRTVTVE